MFRRKVKKYETLKSDDRTFLTELVEQMLDGGWELYGPQSVIVRCIGGQEGAEALEYIQVMVWS